MIHHVNRRFAAVAFWIVVVALTLNATWLAVSKNKKQTKNSSRTPYTVVLAEVVIDGNGVQHSGTLLTQALRTDGSTMQRLGQPENGGRLIELVTGKQIMTTPHTRMKSTWSIAAEPDRWTLDPQSQCTKDLAGQPWAKSIRILGEESIAGYRSIKLEVNEATRWFAMDYGCAPVQTRMDFGKDGASEMHLVSLTLGEPDPALFSVPPDYKEAKPSTAFCGGDCPPHRMTAKFRAMDSDYLGHQ